MKERIAKLINVKTIVTFAITAVFVVLALRGDIDANVTMGVITTVIAFYFGTQTEKKEGK
jgi:galactitol-specific phosphotransferase system IIC component